MQSFLHGNAVLLQNTLKRGPASAQNFLGYIE